LDLCFREHIQQQLLWYGHYEQKELALAGKLIPLNGVVIDAGANFGYHSLWFSRFCPKGCVYAFEPSPPMWQQLLAQLHLNPGATIQPQHLALDSTNGEQDFFIANQDNTGMGGFVDTGNASGKVVRVPCIRLDDFISRNGIHSIDLVKIDVEGAELRVLKGMTYILQVIRPMVMVECSAATLAYHGEKLSTLYELMGSSGYIPFEAVEGSRLRKVHDIRELSLAFFIPEERVEKIKRIQIEN
jgi:FkbM family methyltransferase